MKNIFSAFALIVALSLGTQVSAGFVSNGWGSDDVNQGVLCRFDEKRIEVLAENQRDCMKIGGRATHKISTEKKELPSYARKAK